MAKRRAQTPIQVSEDELKRRHHRQMQLIEKGGNLLRLLMIMGGLWAIVYTGVYLPVSVAVGTSTGINVVQKWIFEADLQVYIAWGTAGACTLYALRERKKRYAERKERDDRIIELERRIDPNRTSSRLTTEGDRLRRDPQ